MHIGIIERGQQTSTDTGHSRGFIYGGGGGTGGNFPPQEKLPNKSIMPTLCEFLGFPVGYRHKVLRFSSKLYTGIRFSRVEVFRFSSKVLGLSHIGK